MPYLMLETSAGVGPERAAEVARRASRLVSELLGKSECWVMVSVRTGSTLAFAGSAEPCAYMELKSLGLTADMAQGLSEGLCRFVADELSIPPDRVYIEMTGPDAALFGWNSGTFG